MTGLLSTSQLNALSGMVKMGMTTDALIYDHVVSQSVDGTAETWVARSESIKCWFYTNPQNSLGIALGLQAVPNLLRMFFELGTDIQTGDRVKVGTQTFTVVDTTKENTIQAMLTVIVRSMD